MSCTFSSVVSDFVSSAGLSAGLLSDEDDAVAPPALPAGVSLDLLSGVAAAAGLGCSENNNHNIVYDNYHIVLIVTQNTRF